MEGNHETDPFLLGGKGKEGCRKAASPDSQFSRQLCGSGQLFQPFQPSQSPFSTPREDPVLNLPQVLSCRGSGFCQCPPPPGRDWVSAGDWELESGGGSRFPGTQRPREELCVLTRHMEKTGLCVSQRPGSGWGLREGRRLAEQPLPWPPSSAQTGVPNSGSQAPPPLLSALIPAPQGSSGPDQLHPCPIASRAWRQGPSGFS